MRTTIVTCDNCGATMAEHEVGSAISVLIESNECKRRVYLSYSPGNEYYGDVCNKCVIEAIYKEHPSQKVGVTIYDK